MTTLGKLIWFILLRWIVYLPWAPWVQRLCSMPKWLLFEVREGEAAAYLQSGVRPWNWSLFWFRLLLPQSQLIVALHCNISWLIVSIPAVQERHLSYVCCLLPIWTVINNYSQIGRKHDKIYIDYKHSILSKEQSGFLVEILNLNVLT